MKYATRKIEVEATQWNGQEIEGLRVMTPKIIFSRDHNLFYVTNTDAKDWLAIEKNENGKYNCYPFAFYEIKSDPNYFSIDEYDDLVELYLKVFDLKKPKTFAFIDNIEVMLGDWIIKREGGRIIRISDEEFKKEYEKL